MTQYLLIAIAVLTGLLGLSGIWIKSLHEDVATEKATAGAFKTQASECVKNNLLANEVSNDYQKQISNLNSQLRSVSLRNVNPLCIVTKKPERGFNATTANGIVSNGNGQGGLSTDWLYDFAGRCEKERLKVIGLQRIFNE